MYYLWYNIIEKARSYKYEKVSVYPYCFAFEFTVFYK